MRVAEALGGRGRQERWTRTVGASTFIADAFARDSQSLSPGFQVFFLTLSLDAQLRLESLHIGLVCSGLS